MARIKNYALEPEYGIAEEDGDHQDHHGQVHRDSDYFLFGQGLMHAFNDVKRPHNPQAPGKDNREPEQIAGDSRMDIDHDGQGCKSQQDQDQFAHPVRAFCKFDFGIHKHCFKG